MYVPLAHIIMIPSQPVSAISL